MHSPSRPARRASRGARSCQPQPAQTSTGLAGGARFSQPRGAPHLAAHAPSNLDSASAHAAGWRGCEFGGCAHGSRGPRACWCFWQMHARAAMDQRPRPALSIPPREHMWTSVSCEALTFHLEPIAMMMSPPALFGCVAALCSRRRPPGALAPHSIGMLNGERAIEVFR